MDTSFLFIKTRRPQNSPLFPYTPFSGSPGRAVLPLPRPPLRAPADLRAGAVRQGVPQRPLRRGGGGDRLGRSEEHTSELQSRQYLVCRLLLEKKKNTQCIYAPTIDEPPY